jgi:phage tail-like protein
VVHTSFVCSEGPFGPGLSLCQDSNGVSASPSLAATKSATGQFATSILGSHTYTAAARSADGLTGGSQIGYKVAAAPSISIVSPIAGHKYTAGQHVPARYSCKDGAYGSGIKSCVGPVHRGALSDTQTLGRVKFTVIAISNDGQKTSKTITYPVAVAITSAPRYIVSIAGQLGGWAFSQLLSLHNSKPVCKRPDGLRVCTGGQAQTVTLRAPLTDDTSLSAWHLKVEQGSPRARKTLTLAIVTTSKSTSTILTYRLTNAWPSKISVSPLKAGNTNTRVITVTFTAASITRLASHNA